MRDGALGCVRERLENRISKLRLMMKKTICKAILIVLCSIRCRYFVLMRTNAPAIGPDGKPVFASGFILARPQRFQGCLSIFGPSVSWANYVFLPIDQLWRHVRGVTPSRWNEEAEVWKWRYTERMVATERWISDSPTFLEFEQQWGMTQNPAFYTDIHFKRFTPDADADLVSMRSAMRKSPHEVVIYGAARTRAHEGVQYWIVIDEAVESK